MGIDAFIRFHQRKVEMFYENHMNGSVVGAIIQNTLNETCIIMLSLYQL